MFESTLRILDRQGLLKGDLNELQRSGLTWLMQREIEDKISLERIRTENMAIAANPTANPKFLEHLRNQREEKENPETLEGELSQEGMDVEWLTPTSVNEIEDVLSNLGLTAS